MIVDHITNAEKYYCTHKLFDKAFNYLKKINFEELADGKYPIVGESCFAIVNRYTTKKASESFAESHKKYIDIQYLVKGKEKIGYGYIKHFENKLYDIETDLQKHEGSLDFITLNKNNFAVFFPDDVHMPGIIASDYEDVLKVVIKIAI